MLVLSGKEKMEDKCKLCGQAAKLVKSHVIPKALHRDQVGALEIVKEGRAYTKKTLTGAYGRFMCQSCENSFGPYDDYGVEFVRKYKDGKAGELFEDSFSKGFSADVDYAMLKPWVLSMLWRGNACDHEMWKGIAIGGKWHDQLTESVRCKSPGSDDDFAVMAELLDEEPSWQVYILTSTTMRIKGNNDYRKGNILYLPSGFNFLIKVDRRQQLPECKPWTLREGEPFLIRRSGFSEAVKTSLKHRPKG